MKLEFNFRSLLGFGRRRRFAVCLLCFLLLLSEFSPACIAESFFLSGHSEYRLNGGWPDSLKTKLLDSEDYDQLWLWDLTLDGNKWKLNVKADHGSANYLIGSDGAETITLQLFNTDTNRIRDKGINDSDAVIEEGVMPSEGALSAQPVWLALCCPNLAKHFSNEKMPSLSTLGGAPATGESRNVTYPIEYALVNHAPLYFTVFEQFDDGYSRRTLEDGRLDVIRRNPPYDNGFVRLRLKAGELAEFSGVTMPGSFVYQRLKPGGVDSEGQPDPLVFDTWIVYLENVTETNVPDDFWIPTPTGATDVSDRRYANASPPVFSIDYRLREDVWPKKNSPFLRQLYEEASGISLKSLPRNRVRRGTILAAFVIISLVILIGLWRRVFVARRNGN